MHITDYMGKTLSNIVRAIKEASLPVWMPFRRNAAYTPLSGRKDGLVVSLTSFPERIGNLWMVLDSLFRQDVRPDKIVVVLTKEEVPEGASSLPESLRKFEPLGVETVFLPYNLRCHNKYFYAFGRYPDATVVTVDDDCIYRKDTLKRLVDLHRKNPGAVCCNIAAVIDPDDFTSYKAWKKSSSEGEPDHLNVALGFAGILYPEDIDRTIFLDRETAEKLAPTADDLWLKAVEIDRGIKVARGRFFPKPVTIKSSQKVSLRSVNKGTESRNDRQWEALDGHFHLREKLNHQPGF